MSTKNSKALNKPYRFLFFLYLRWILLIINWFTLSIYHQTFTPVVGSSGHCYFLSSEDPQPQKINSVASHINYIYFFI